MLTYDLMMDNEGKNEDDEDRDDNTQKWDSLSNIPEVFTCLVHTMKEAVVYVLDINGELNIPC